MTAQLHGNDEKELREYRRLFGDLSELKPKGEMLDFLRDILPGIVRYIDGHPEELTKLRQEVPLSASEQEALSSAGISFEASQRPMRPVIKTLTSHRRMIASAISVDDAARILGVNGSRVRQRILARSLLAVKDSLGKAWCIPGFQFAGGAELPGLALVLKAMRRDIDPIVVFRFFETPQVDLTDDEGDSLTPAEWLGSGGEVAPLVELARSI